jgi:hypothetical protein
MYEVQRTYEGDQFRVVKKVTDQEGTTVVTTISVHSTEPQANAALAALTAK